MTVKRIRQSRGQTIQSFQPGAVFRREPSISETFPVLMLLDNGGVVNLESGHYTKPENVNKEPFYISCSAILEVTE